MQSVGYAWAILKGRATGDKKQAQKFLSNMSKEEYTARNRTESRSRGKLKKRSYPMGSRSKR